MSVPFTKRFPRLTTFVLLAIIFLVLIAIVSPVQLPVVLYKMALISLAAVLGYWLDRALFPYARPHGYLVDDWRKPCQPDTRKSLELQDPDFPVLHNHHLLFIGSTLRRAIIIFAVVIGVALGL